MARLDRQRFLNEVLRPGGLSEHSPRISAFDTARGNEYTGDDIVLDTGNEYDYVSPGMR